MLSGIISSAPAALRRSAAAGQAVLHGCALMLSALKPGSGRSRASAAGGHCAAHGVAGGSLAERSGSGNGSLVRMVLISALLGTVLSGCGFTLPNQAPLEQTIPEIVVTGDYNSPFYRKVITRLKANGVRVYSQESGYNPVNNGTIPSLMIPNPSISDKVVSVNSRAQAIENAIVIFVAATLSVPNHRPIVMRNSITRSVLNKPGQSLASDTEKSTVIDETLSQLADDLVFRLGYLGRSTDPDVAVPQPYELLSSDEEDIDPGNRATSGMTLIEALQAQDNYESATGTAISLDELDNGDVILGTGTRPDGRATVTGTKSAAAGNAPAGNATAGNAASGNATAEGLTPASSEKTSRPSRWELPKVKIERLHKAPVTQY